MRSLSASLLPFALTAGVLLPLSAAHAQQAAPASMTAPSASLSDMAPLALPSPPGAKLRFEMDARSEDLLGLVKSFLKGLGETRKGETVSANTAPAAPINPIEEALENGNLADILKDVNHFHFVVWEVPPPASSSAGAAKPLLKPSVPVSALAALDTNSFYETAFQPEGAHRVLFTDADEYKLVMVGFPGQHGFAFAASDITPAAGGYIVAARSDGYPNMEALTAFVSRMTSAVMKTHAGKHMMDSVLNDSPLPGVGGKGTDKK